jgi:predicted RNA binding protein YcfA (HicA-like mRNA interferase family)
MPISGKNVIRILAAKGWVFISHNGSHVKMKKDGKVAIVPVHGNKDLPRGTLKSIEKQTGEKIL